SIASEAIRKLLSASPGGTCRSSPKKNCIFLHGTIARSGPLFSSNPYRAFGVEPPARATEKESFKQTASRAASTNSAAAVCAMALESVKVLISRLIIVVVIVGIAVVIVSAPPRSPVALSPDPGWAPATRVLPRSFATRVHRVTATHRLLPAPSFRPHSSENLRTLRRTTHRVPVGLRSNPPQPYPHAGTT